MASEGKSGVFQGFFATDGKRLNRAEEIEPYLGKRAHLVVGRSAYEAAFSWFDAQGLPAPVRTLLDNDPAFAGATLLKAVFEKKTTLDPFGRASQTDVMAFLETRSGPAIVGIEAKVDESFGPVVSEWRTVATTRSDGSASSLEGKVARLAGLVQRLELDANAIDSIRYQLLHRTAAVLIEAMNARVSEAALVVQSFSPPHIRAGFADFLAFTAAIGAPVEKPGSLSTPIERSSIRIRFGWAEDSLRTDRLEAMT